MNEVKNRESGIDQPQEPLNVLTRSHQRSILRECEALVVYIARHGDVLCPGDTEPSSDQSSRSRYELFHDFSEQVAEVSIADEIAPEQWASLMDIYAKVTAITYSEKGVNGRSVLDTFGKAAKIISLNDVEPTSRATRLLQFFNRLFRRRGAVYTATFVFFVLALGLQYSTTIAGQVGEPPKFGDGWKFYVYFFVTDLGQWLIPATWGGLGSCVYLMKRISDKLYELAFEESRLNGISARIIIGAMLGAIFTNLVFPDFDQVLTLDEFSFGPITVAFLTGLFIKPIYAAFESLATRMSARFSGHSDQRQSKE